MKAREFPFIRTPFAILSLLGVLAFGSVSLARVSQAVPGDGRGDALITNFHGTQYLLSTFAAAGKYFANASITAATADENGTRLSIGRVAKTDYPSAPVNREDPYPKPFDQRRLTPSLRQFLKSW